MSNHNLRLKVAVTDRGDDLGQVVSKDISPRRLPDGGKRESKEKSKVSCWFVGSADEHAVHKLLRRIVPVYTVGHVTNPSRDNDIRNHYVYRQQICND